MSSLPIEAFRPSPEALTAVSTLRARRSLSGLEAVVVGAGRSGLSAARLLVGRGASVRLMDERAYEALDPALRKDFSPECVGPIDSALCGAADLVVLSPGVPRTRPELHGALRRGVLVGEVELAAWFIERPVVAITGTNGKSTTTALVGHLLETGGHRTFVGGNLGRPATEMAEGSFDVGVLELSSYQLESMVSARFEVGVWLNLTPDHLDRYPDVAHYAAAKARLLELVPPDGSLVLNAEDELLADLGRAYENVRWFSAEDVSAEFSSPALPGRHNLSNTAAALRAVEPFALSPEVLRRGLRSFPGLPHRLERVRELDGVDYYNDSKATNVDSACTAVRAFSRPKILIAGGKDKGASWQPLVEASRPSVKAVMAIGQAEGIAAAAFDGAVPVLERVGDLASAVMRAQALSVPGDVVLLSPACASFDQFRSFEHRGDEFRRLVQSLAPMRRTDG